MDQILKNAYSEIKGFALYTVISQFLLCLVMRMFPNSYRMDFNTYCETDLTQYQADDLTNNVMVEWVEISTTQ